MKQILIIEDDVAIAEIERDFLAINGFAVTVETDGRAGLEKALAGRFDLVLLDLMLPGADGYEVCRRIRDRLDIPILMVTAKIEEVDKIRGLGLGADDYIPKPFSPTELVARVKANLAQYERLKGSGDPKPVAELRTGNLTIQPGARRVLVNGQEVELKNREYELLLFLVTNADIVFSKEELYRKIWGMDAFGDIKTVAVHIGRLREKIEDDPANPTRIQTVWGAGYRFQA